jgi:hypothetical protein
MFRPSLVKAVRPAIRYSIPARATFTTSSRVMAEGDTGGIRPGGGAQGYALHVTDFVARKDRMLIFENQRCVHKAREGQ